MPEMEQILFFQSTAQFVFFQQGSGSTETLLIHNMRLIINHEKNGNAALYSVIKDPMMLDNVLPHPKELLLH